MIVRVAVVSATLLGILSVRLASVQPVTVADEIPAVAVKMLVIVDQHGPDRNAATILFETSLSTSTVLMFCRRIRPSSLPLFRGGGG